MAAPPFALPLRAAMVLPTLGLPLPLAVVLSDGRNGAAGDLFAMRWSLPSSSSSIKSMATVCGGELRGAPALGCESVASRGGRNCRRTPDAEDDDDEEEEDITTYASSSSSAFACEFCTGDEPRQMLSALAPASAGSAYKNGMVPPTGDRTDEADATTAETALSLLATSGVNTLRGELRVATFGGRAGDRSRAADFASATSFSFPFPLLLTSLDSASSSAASAAP
jgi:hypothetical protein